jgi:MoxR-like ATPase
MEERQVTVENVTYPLPRPFLVVATENPVDQHGTYPLPEGQLDRFAMTVSVGYPDDASASEIVRRQLLGHPIDDLGPVVSASEIVEHQRAVRGVHVEQPVVDYVVALAKATRDHGDILLGASPRAMVSLTRVAQSRAAMHGRGFVLPDDVKAMATAVLAHRLIPRSRGTVASGTARDVVRELLERVPVPLGAAR